MGVRALGLHPEHEAGGDIGGAVEATHESIAAPRHCGAQSE